MPPPLLSVKMGVIEGISWIVIPNRLLFAKLRQNSSSILSDLSSHIYTICGTLTVNFKVVHRQKCCTFPLIPVHSVDRVLGVYY